VGIRPRSSRDRIRGSVVHRPGVARRRLEVARSLLGHQSLDSSCPRAVERPSREPLALLGLDRAEGKQDRLDRGSWLGIEVGRSWSQRNRLNKNSIGKGLPHRGTTVGCSS